MSQNSNKQTFNLYTSLNEIYRLVNKKQTNSIYKPIKTSKLTIV